MKRRLLGLAVAVATSVIALPAGAQNWRTLTSARQLRGTEPVEVEVSYGAGQMEIEALDSPSLLYRMEMRYDENGVTPVAEFDSATRRLELGMRGGPGRDREHRRIRAGSTISIALTDQVPLDLGLHFGAGEAEIDLGGLRISRLSLETGASETEVRIGAPNPIRAKEVVLQAGAAELRVIGLGNLRADRISFQGGVGSTTLDFSGAWDRNSVASVQIGVGEVVLRFPRSLGVRINRSSFLTSFEAGNFAKRGNSYYSDNWESAGRQLVVDVGAALGSVEIEWIDN